MILRRIALIVAICGLVTGGLTQSAQAQREGGRRGFHRDRQAAAAQSQRVDHRQQALASLGLTDEQRSQLDALREQGRAQIKALRESGQRPTREQIEQMRETHRAQFESILTPDQLAKLQELRNTRRHGASVEAASEGTTGPAKAVAPGQGVQNSSWGSVKRAR